MSEYREKITSISNKIVKKYNKKNIDVNEIIESIKKVKNRSSYNEEGQYLVLEGIEKQIETLPIEMFINNGEISESVKNSAISYAVKTANSRGINIIDATKSTNDSINNDMSDNVTIVSKVSNRIIEKMEKDFDSLSFEEIEELIENFRELTPEQRKNFNKKFVENALNTPGLPEEVRFKIEQEGERLGESTDLVDFAEQFSKIFGEDTLIQEQKLEEFRQRAKKSPQEMRRISKLLKKNPQYLNKAAKEVYESELNNCKSSHDNITRIKMEVSLARDEKGELSPKDKEKLEKYKKKNPNFEREVKEKRKKYEEILQDGKDSDESMPRDDTTVSENKNSFVEIFQSIEDTISPTVEDETGLSTLNDKEKEKIPLLKSFEKVCISLMKDFSEEEIKETLSLYKNYFKNASEDDIKFLSEQTDEERISILEEEFVGIDTNEKSSEILQILAKQDFDGQLFDILGDETRRTEFFEQLDQVIEHGIEEQEMPISDRAVEEGIKSGKVKEEYIDTTLIEQTKSQTKNRSGQEYEEPQAPNNKLTDAATSIGNSSDMSGDAGSSDSSATQGSTSSGKVTISNFVNYSNGSNVTLSDVTEVSKEAKGDAQKVEESEKGEGDKSQEVENDQK